MKRGRTDGYGETLCSEAVAEMQRLSMIIYGSKLTDATFDKLHSDDLANIIQVAQRDPRLVQWRERLAE